ncbi:hypothetical protein V1T76_27355 [Roseibium sp. FZY0029]|uniref:hypothetical protein n=1 Tax=Roseibium sp. FZY0029 TaxID=3116647 RepID=UPI002EBA33CB|nr:hypothetical protein [Roseibium sp. FZY0029]
MPALRFIRSGRILLLLLATTFTAAVYLDRKFGYDTYRVDDWCLRFKPSEVEWPNDSPFLRKTSPFFFVRAPVPYMGAEAPSDQGIVVNFWKQSANERDHRIEENGSLRWGCNIRDAQFGLVELYKGEGRCFRANGSKRYEPKQKTGVDAAVSIACSTDVSVKNCKISDVLPNNWEARIAIPKASLSKWRAATAAARNFFDKKLQDCGTER